MTGAEIITRLPAETRFLALTRVMTASLAAELGFSIDTIDDLRVAVDEVVSAVIDAAGDGGTVDLRFSVADDQLAVTVTNPDGGQLDVDPLSRQILAAVTDGFEIGAASASFVRRRDPVDQ